MLIDEGIDGEDLSPEIIGRHQRLQKHNHRTLQPSSAESGGKVVLRSRQIAPRHLIALTTILDF